MNRRGFAKGVFGGLVGVVGAMAMKHESPASTYEPLAGSINKPNLPANDYLDDVFSTYHTVGGSGSLLQIMSEDIPGLQCSYNIMQGDNNPIFFHDTEGLMLYAKSKKEEDRPETQLLTFLYGFKYIQDIKDQNKVWTLNDDWIPLGDCSF